MEKSIKCRDCSVVLVDFRKNKNQGTSAGSSRGTKKISNSGSKSREVSKSQSKGNCSLRDRKEYNYKGKHTAVKDVSYSKLLNSDDSFDSEDELLHFYKEKATESYEKLRMEEAKSAWSANLSGVAEETLEEDLGHWPSPKKKIKRDVNPNRRPRKQRPPQEDEPVTYAQICNIIGRVLQKVPIATMPRVEQNPPMIHWTDTKINYRVKDGEFLANYPYLGEDVDPEFENELYDLYDEKDYNSAQVPKMSDEVFMEIINSYENSLEKRRQKPSCSNRKSPILDEPFVKVLRYGVLMPPRIVFSTVAKCFSFLGFPYELEERYAKVQKESNAKLNPVADDPDSPNIDEELKEALDPKRALNTFHKLFCPRCMVYCCVTHNEDDQIEPKYITRRVVALQDIAEVECKHSDCINKTSAIKTKKGKEPLKFCDKWTPTDITMCKLLLQSAQNNPCYVASIMVTKSCREVQEFLDWDRDRIKIESTSSEVQDLEKKTNSPTTSSHSNVKVSSWCEKYVPKVVIEPEDVPHYKPCAHLPNEGCNSENLCCCVLGSTFCERWCGCPPDCARRFKGCKCRAGCGTIACPCYRAHRECDPLLCLNCGSENPIQEPGKCQNVAILHNREKPIKLKKSPVAGWGGFIGCDARKWELVSEYRGEVISNTESARRAFYYHKIRHTYLFSLNEELVVDATRMGSKVRFVNSSNKPNCFAKVMMVNGDHRIGIYAKRNLIEGEELFFDYQNIIKDSKAGKGPRKRASKQSKSKQAIQHSVKGGKK